MFIPFSSNSQAIQQPTKYIHIGVVFILLHTSHFIYKTILFEMYTHIYAYLSNMCTFPFHFPKSDK